MKNQKKKSRQIIVKIDDTNVISQIFVCKSLIKITDELSLIVHNFSKMFGSFWS